MAVLTDGTAVKQAEDEPNDAAHIPTAPLEEGVYISLDNQARVRPVPPVRREKQGCSQALKSKLSEKTQNDILMVLIIFFVVLTTFGLGFLFITGRISDGFFHKHSVLQSNPHLRLDNSPFLNGDCLPGFVSNKPDILTASRPCIHERSYKTEKGLQKVLHDLGNRVSAVVCPDRCLLYDMSEIEGGCCPLHYPFSLDERVGVTVLSGPLGQIALEENIKLIPVYRCMAPASNNLSFAGPAIQQACSGRPSFKVNSYGARYVSGYRRISASLIDVALRRMDPSHKPLELTSRYHNSIELFRDPGFPALPNSLRPMSALLSALFGTRLHVVRKKEAPDALMKVSGSPNQNDPMPSSFGRFEIFVLSFPSRTLREKSRRELISHPFMDANLTALEQKWKNHRRPQKNQEDSNWLSAATATGDKEIKLMESENEPNFVKAGTGTQGKISNKPTGNEFMASRGDDDDFEESTSPAATSKAVKAPKISDIVRKLLSVQEERGMVAVEPNSDGYLSKNEPVQPKGEHVRLRKRWINAAIDTLKDLLMTALEKPRSLAEKHLKSKEVEKMAETGNSSPALEDSVSSKILAPLLKARKMMEDNQVKSMGTMKDVLGALKKSGIDEANETTSSPLKENPPLVEKLEELLD